MRYYFYPAMNVAILSVVLILCIGWSENRVKPPYDTYISGTVYEVRENCDTLADTISFQPKPLQNCTLIARAYNGYGGIQYEEKVVTNAEGKFEFKKKIWMDVTFYFYEEYKTKKFRVPRNSATTKWDTACYRQEFNTADFVHLVKKYGSNKYEFNITRNCEGMNKCCERISTAIPAEVPVNRSGNQPGHQE